MPLPPVFEQTARISTLYFIVEQRDGPERSFPQRWKAILAGQQQVVADLKEAAAKWKALEAERTADETKQEDWAKQCKALTDTMNGWSARQMEFLAEDAVKNFVAEEGPLITRSRVIVAEKALIAKREALIGREEASIAGRQLAITKEEALLARREIIIAREHGFLTKRMNDVTSEESQINHSGRIVASEEELIAKKRKKSSGIVED
jgi:hypothetical protein